MKKLLAILMVLCLAIPLAAAQEAPATGLIGLKAEDAARISELHPAFDPAVKDYFMFVQSDVYGIRFTPELSEGVTATVRMSGTGIEPSEIEVASGESFILDLTQQYEYLRERAVSTAVIEAAGDVYTVVVKREDSNYLYDAFELNTHQLPGGKEMYYWQYVPEDYDPAREYPVVLYLHGVGQRSQDAEMVLMRNQSATSFVKYGYDAIVIAPQCNYTDLSDGTLMWSGEDMGLTIFGQGAYDILQKVKAQYNIDEARQYVTGLSMGGIGSYAMITNYPGDFAASIINCGICYDTDKFINALKAGGTQILLSHATGDESVDFSCFQDITHALNNAGVNYAAVVYGPDDFIYPMRHFNWQPIYADTEILNWMMSQKRGAAAGELIDLKVEEPALNPTPVFDLNTNSYELKVQPATYGLSFTPLASGSVIINGQEVKSGERYVLELSQEYEDYEKNLTYDVVITAANGTYVYKVIRESGKPYYDEFELKTFEIEGGEMPYWLRVPEDYDSSKAYPVVMFLHGGGQGRQEPSMILRRTMSATSYAIFEEDAIIIAPHANYTDLSSEEIWGDIQTMALQMNKFGQGAYDILQQVKQEYNVDESRLYLNGLSMGGNCALAMLVTYPDEFAAAVVSAPATYGGYERLGNLVGSGVKLWLITHEYDTTLDVSVYATVAQTLDELGFEYVETYLQPHVFLWPNPHFSWTVPDASREVHDWVFAQSR